MAANWFCKIMGDEKGPLTATELQEIARSGGLGIDDLVRSEAHSTWVRAENVVGLFDRPSLPVVASESIAVIDDATVRATWAATASLSDAGGQNCSIEVNATTVNCGNISSTAVGGTTNQSPRATAARISSVVVPRRSLKMSVDTRSEATVRNSANRTTRAMNFDSQADTVACANATHNEDQSKTIQGPSVVQPANQSVAGGELAEQCL